MNRSGFCEAAGLSEVEVRQHMKIKEYREAAGLSQSDLSKIMGVDTAAVNRWDSNKSLPRTDKLPKLADLFGCSIDELFGRNPSKQTLA